MKVTILGATGATGTHLVEQAIAQGHAVTALVRKAGSMGRLGDRVSVIEGDVLARETLRPAIEGRDAVLSALGPPRNNSGDPRTVEAVGNVVATLGAVGVRRLIFLSAFGVGDSRAQTSLLFRLVAFRVLSLQALYANKEQEEEIIRRSPGLDWTIVRAAHLTDKPARGACRVIEGRGKLVEGIARADVARFMLAQLTDDRYVGKAVSIAW